MTSLGEYAFAGCNLTDIAFSGDAPTVGTDAFDGVAAGCTATVEWGTSGWDDDGDGKWQGLTLVYRNMPQPDGGPYAAVVDGITWTYTVSNGEASVGGGTRESPAVPKTTTGNIVIPPTLGGCPVTSIGDYAFPNYGGLTGVTMPDGVTSIGDNAFRDCFVLTSVTMPASVTSIGDNAFWGCCGLTSVTIPASVTSIGEGAFFSCYGLTSVTIPDGVTSINDNVFHSCNSLTGVTIPAGVTSIGDYAFYGCSGLTSVEIPEGVTSIGDDAFWGCSGLTSVAIPSSVTRIGYGAFAGCSGLTGVAIPSSVTRIEDGTFCCCSGLTSITIPASVTNIGDYAFSSCDNLTGVTISEGVTSIGDSAFSDCVGLTSVTLPECLDIIGSYAFAGCSGLTEMSIPSSVTSIGTGAFDDCTELWAVRLTPRSGANYDFLKGTGAPIDIEIPSGTESIGGYAFYNCNRLGRAMIYDGVTSIGEGAFAGCSGLMMVDIPLSVTSIGDYAFDNCSGLGWVVIPGNVTSIGDGAFRDCSGLAGVEICEGVTSIGSYAFAGCSGLTEMSIPSSVTSIGTGAFDDCTELWAVRLTPRRGANYDFLKGTGAPIDIEIPSGTESIGGYAFYNCNRLGRARIYEGVTSIGEGAFAGCSGLMMVDIPWSVTSIGDYAFDNCSGLGWVVIPGNVTSIGDGAFRDCSWLAGVEICEGVTSIGWHAFSECHNLTSVTIPASVTNIGGGAFSGCGSLAEVTIPSGVTSISDQVFYGCIGLTSVTIPEGVMDIGRDAFSFCYSLTTVTIPTSVTRIGEGAFYCCHNLTGVTMLDGVADIGDSAFSACRGLTSVVIPSSVTRIGAYAFSGCSGLTSVTIPEGVTSIGDGAFRDCCGLTGVEIPEGVTSIGDSAFYGCHMEEMTIPGSVMSFGKCAFYDCSGLTNVTFGGNAPVVGENAFSGVASDCTATVGLGTSGWDDDGDGRWQGLRLVYQNRSLTIAFAAVGYDGVYDGNGHGIAVNVSDPAAGATVTYALAEDGPYSGAPILFTNVTDGAQAVYFKIAAEGFLPTNGVAHVAIAPKTLTVDMVGDIPTQTYTGEALVPAVTVADVMPCVVTAEDYAVSYADNVRPGLATATVTGQGNYTGTVQKTFAIVAATSGEFGAALGASDLTWATDGDAPWTVGADVARSGVISHGEQSVLAVTLEGAGTLTFDWRTSCEVRYDALRLVVDGKTVRQISGETAWTNESVTVGNGSHTVRWIYKKNRSVSTGEDVAWLANVVWTPSAVPTLAEALNGTLTWTTGGDADWEAVRTDSAYEGGICALSGVIGDYGVSYVETTVSGAGRLDFVWAVSCEDGYDGYDFLLDGKLVGSITGEADWTAERFDLGEGTHVLRWEYWKDEMDEPDMTGADCAFLDYVRWTPAGGVTDPDLNTEQLSEFCLWLKEHRLLDANATEADALALKTAGVSGKATTALAEFVAGTDPEDETDKFTAKVEFVDGKPVVTWEPALNGEGVKEGVRTYRTLGVKTLGDEWTEVPEGCESEYNFFRVEVSLP